MHQNPDVLRCRRTGLKSQTIALDLEWAAGDWSQLANRILKIFPLVQAGAYLTTAARGAALASSQHSEDCQSALEAYRDGPQARLKAITWNRDQPRPGSAAEAQCTDRWR
jgi:hypothetical protein